jgi:hypothetical protein
LHLAIDHHRKQLTVNLRGEVGGVFLRRHVSTRWSDMRAFLAEAPSSSAAESG